MKDYRITVKIKNNYMLKAMEKAGFYSGASLSKASNVGQTPISYFLNLKKPAYNLDGTFKKDVLKISKTLKVLPEDLFPTQHLINPLEINKAEVEADFEEIKQITSSQKTPYDQIVLEENCKLVNDVVSRLTKVEQDVINRRFGLNDEDKCTLNEISRDYECSRQRIQQIKNRALQKLKEEDELRSSYETQ